MSTLIICPNCKTQFEPEAAIAQSVEDRVRKEFNQKWADLTKQKDDQMRQKEQQWQEERKLAEDNLRQEVNAKIRADFENQMRLLEDINKTNQAKLTEAREKELEFLKKMQDLKTKEQELELEVQRKLMDERNKLSEAIKKEEEERNKLKETEHQMRMMELQKQLDDQRKLVEEMKRKSEQGSMQLQGEVQELLLEQILRDAFPFDLVQEVGKGIKGADCVQVVRNNFAQECGKIIFESKRTKDFSAEWIEKLKADMRVLNADIAVIVTQAMPKDMSTFGEKDGIWVCNFGEVRALVGVLRNLIIEVYNTSKRHENKGDKMTLLYNYLLSNEFKGQWKAISEGFLRMRMSIQKEREQMEKLWKAREKELEKVLLNAAHIRGSIEGIAGMDVDLNLTADEDKYLLE